MTGSMQRLACKAVILLLLAVATREELNVALGRPAYQTTDWGDVSPAGLAVDGDRNGDFGAKSCASTAGSKGTKQWWAVDLGRQTPVLKVTISNRIDCCVDRLHDFTVGLTNILPTRTTGPDQSIHRVCLVYTGIFPPAVKTLVCDQIVSGRYLFVQINSFREETLTLCEVEVYLTAIATGFREFGDCAVFTDHDKNSCAEVTSSDTPLDFVLKANISQSENATGVRITLRNGDCDDSKQVMIVVYKY
ncbi:hypothetical protein NP493_429g02000 [Ridgeia piscesae]|uniref:Fucolectin tachylectin-4 pentraxin-1 domain-containing protein n=1 Tax=Ridgeia piscesae TaxID=27915 RepID=A0AAD9KZV1_RIDPI|nr:hypothetical protein NP493_429g02000 [Ridgeia piscesae]